MEIELVTTWTFVLMYKTDGCVVTWPGWFGNFAILVLRSDNVWHWSCGNVSGSGSTAIGMRMKRAVAAAGAAATATAAAGPGRRRRASVGRGASPNLLMRRKAQKRMAAIMILTKVDTRTDPALAPDHVIENIPSLLQNYCRRFFSRAL